MDAEEGPESSELRNKNITSYKTPGQYCSAINCKNTRNRNPGLTFFKFPKDEKRRVRWAINTRRSDLICKSAKSLCKSYALCADHFEDLMFMNADQKKRLVWNAIPTLFDVPNPPKRVTPSRPLPVRHPLPPPKEKPKPIPPPDVNEGSSSNPAAESADVSHLKCDKMKTQMRREVQRLCVKVCRMKKKIAKLEALNKGSVNIKKGTLLSALPSYLSGESLDFIYSQIKNSEKSPHGKRYRPCDIGFATKIYDCSPTAYRLLKKSFFLPTVKTILKMKKTGGLKNKEAVGEPSETQTGLHVVKSEMSVDVQPVQVSENQSMCDRATELPSMPWNAANEVYVKQVDRVANKQHIDCIIRNIPEILSTMASKENKSGSKIQISSENGCLEAMKIPGNNREKRLIFKVKCFPPENNAKQCL